MPLTKNDLRYYAGFFDGEGSISVIRQRVDNFNGFRFRVELGIGQTAHETLYPLLEAYGGSKYIQKRSTAMPNGKPILQVRWFALRARRVLKDLLPFLRLKRHRAELALEAIELISALRGGRGHRRPYPRRLTEIYEEMKRLNKRGVK